MKKVTSIQLLLFFFSAFASNLFAQDFSVSVKEVKGFAFIERRDKTVSFSVFRGSEIKEDSLVKTDTKSQVILSVVKGGVNVCDLLLGSDTVVFVNKTLFDSNNKISLSLIQGHIRLQCFNSGVDLEVHMANVSSIVNNGDIEFAVSIDGSSIIYSITADIASYTETSNIILKAKDIYIVESGSYNFSRSDVKPEVFLTVSEDKSIKNIDDSLSKLIELMRELNNQFIILDSNLRDAERQSDELLFIPVEIKSHRLLSANEGYYHSANKILNMESVKSRNAFDFTKTLNNLYYLNNKYIEKINLNLERNKARIERAKKLY